EGSSLFEPSDDDFYEAYRFILPGYNVRPQEINAAVGLVQLAKLPAMTAARRQNLAKFQDLFGGDERFIVQRENGKSSSFCFTIILSPDKDLDRARVMEALKEADIGFRVITGGCFPRHDVIKYFDHELVGPMTNGDLAHDRGFFVGNHPFDLGAEIDTLHQVLDAACK
ncbi:MAG: DegT/DnrJ/EryC1/StrS family aminotransferase, partial [Pseudomonadota bacterium]|nr:DegT/DnrJ/EryC1/StrS family aminotransferase [Pseudomonadota bacterium]